MARAATAAAAASAAGEAPGRGRRAPAGRGEDGKLNGGFLAGTVRAGNLLLLVYYDFLEALVARIADVLINRHDGRSPEPHQW